MKSGKASSEYVYSKADPARFWLGNRRIEIDFKRDRTNEKRQEY